VERTERKLCTRLTDSLCGNHTDGLSHLHHARRCEVSTVALAAYALFALTGQHGTNLDHLDLSSLYGLGLGFGNLFSGHHDDFVGMRIDDVVYRNTSEDSL